MPFGTRSARSNRTFSNILFVAIRVLYLSFYFGRFSTFPLPTLPPSPRPCAYPIFFCAALSSPSPSTLQLHLNRVIIANNGINNGYISAILAGESMRYDPLHAATDPDNASSHFLQARRPQIFDVKLTPLEWSDSRKRPRPDGAAAPVKGRPEGDGPSSTTPQQQPPPPPRVETREVVRIVEKMVPYEPVTVLGGPPLVDDRVRHLVNFILHHVNAPNVEVEAKLGVLIEKNENVRAVELVPVMCETPIIKASNGDVRFESDVGEDLFYRLNEELNKRVEATSNQTQGAVRYFRTKEVDYYYPGRIRETCAVRRLPDGTEASERIRVQRKTRLGDMNVLSPGRLCDIRYSASVEEDCDMPEGNPEMKRVKDRISYKYECLSIDITCVDRQGSRDSAKTHEVEVEIDASATNLYEEVMKYKNQDETSKLFDIASSLVSTVRILLEQ